MDVTICANVTITFLLPLLLISNTFHTFPGEANISSNSAMLTFSVNNGYNQGFVKCTWKKNFLTRASFAKQNLFNSFMTENGMVSI